MPLLWPPESQSGLGTRDQEDRVAGSVTWPSPSPTFRLHKPGLLRDLPPTRNYRDMRKQLGVHPVPVSLHASSSNVPAIVNLTCVLGHVFKILGYF